MQQQTDLRLIIIDDNPEIHKDFIKILATNNLNAKTFDSLDQELFGEEAGTPKLLLPKFHIDTASQGQEGVERIKTALTEKNPYALAFVDIRMPPGWDGIETIKHIWALDPNIQVVICTAYSDYTWEETIEQLGMTDNLLILKKPFDNVAIRQLACALTKKWQLMKEAKEYTEFLQERVDERTNSLKKSLSVIRATLESSADGILVVDKSGAIVDRNNKFVELWKIPTSVLEANDSNLMFEYVLCQLEDKDEFSAKMKRINAHPELINVDKVKFKDGRIFEWYTQPHKLNKEAIGRVWSFRDVTENVRLEEQLAYQASHDMLTGLPNRVLLADRIKQAIAGATRNETFVGILFFDLDRFKLINDSFSHATGDELLQSVAKRLQLVTRKQDTLARLGGDEFVMIVADLHNEEHLINIADKLLNAIRQPFRVANTEIIITSSIGVSIFPQNGKNAEELLRNADLAMYRAKEIGTNQFQFYAANMNEKSLQRLETESELQRALANDEFFLCYQPQIDVKSQKVVAVEALIRWKHPKKGVVLPLEFVPLAEETGLIIPVGEWVLKTACKQAKKWQEQGFSPLRMAVNVTTLQIRQDNFVENVQKILKETKLKPEFLELELTENVIVSAKEVTQVIAKLKDLGVQIVLDDFGTGNSSLNYLRKIPIDRLKIDRSFIRNINSSRNDEVILKAIITMANGLNLDVVAEGIETQEQLDVLKEQKCQEVQGFYYSKPLSEKDLQEFLSKNLSKLDKK